jgi:hypothetical protein
MECINATRLRRKSGPWGTQHLLLRDVASPLRAHNPQRRSTGGEDGREQVEGERTAQVRFGASARHQAERVLSAGRDAFLLDSVERLDRPFQLDFGSGLSGLAVRETACCP